MSLKDLTIEEARERYELGTFERLVAELRHFTEYDDIARENTNAKNRAKTQVSKAFKQLILNEEIEQGDRVLVGEQAFFYDFSVSESVSPEGFLKLYEAGEVSRELYLKCISVQKDLATKLIGMHVLESIVERKVGKTADVRKDDLDKPIAEDFVLEKKKPKPGKVKKTQQQPLPKEGVSSKPVRRRIRVNS